VPFTLVELSSYIGIVALLVMFPGPNTVLVMQSVAVNGRRAGFYNVLGIITSVYCNALLSGLGLSLIILQSAAVYNALKMLGAGYIAYLGAASLIDAYRLHKQPESPVDDAGEQGGDAAISGNRLACYAKGVLTGVLNPKAALFFLAFFPQFLHQDGNIAVQSVILTVLYAASPVQ
jgi:threonine/homoserine/homoserine lactone efflux protein